MYKFLSNNIIFIIFIICSLILSSAYFIELVLGYEPCNLCFFERIPYFFVIMFSLFFLIFKKHKKIILIFIFISFILSTLLAFYHMGIEQNFFDESFACKISNFNPNFSANDLLKELEGNNKSCKQVDLKIFGLSLATINFFLSLTFSVFLLYIIKKNEEN